MEDKQLEEALAASIEKSFNDSELEDIMNEIENLEREFSEDVTVAKDSTLSLEKARDNNLQKVIDDEVASINSELDSTDQAPVEAVVEMAAEEEEFDEQDFANMADETDEMTAQNQEATQDDVMDAVMGQVEQAEYEDEMHAMEETIAAEQVDTIKDEEVNNVFTISTPKTTRAEHMSAAPAVSAGSNAVAMSAAGAMNLNINFNVAGQDANLSIQDGGLKVTLNGVELTIDETNGCLVSLAGGVTFSIPLNLANGASKKNAA